MNDIQYYSRHFLSDLYEFVTADVQTRGMSECDFFLNFGTLIAVLGKIEEFIDVS
jgi:hypothetical protein